MSTLKFHVNVSDLDAPRGSSGTEFVEVNFASDRIIFSKGSDIVKDGAVIPGEAALNRAGQLIDPDTAVIIPKYFLADVSDGILREIKLAGNQLARYVFCVALDDATNSIPVLELWDDVSENSINLAVLGAGNPNNSWFWSITTTNEAPPAGWLGLSPTAGLKLAGASENHFLELDSAPLDAAKDLYFQMKIIVPAGFPTAGAVTPVMVSKWS